MTYILRTENECLIYIFLFYTVSLIYLYIMRYKHNIRYRWTEYTSSPRKQCAKIYSTHCYMQLYNIRLLKSLTFLLGRITVAMLYSDVKYFTNDHVFEYIYIYNVFMYNLQLNEWLYITYTYQWQISTYASSIIALYLNYSYLTSIDAVKP